MKDTQHSWVKHLVDWGPLAAFFIAFKVGGIMQATVVLIGVTVDQVVAARRLRVGKAEGPLEPTPGSAAPDGG